MGQSRVSPARYPTPSAGACEHDEVSGYTPSSISPLPDSLVVLCFTQTSTVMKAEMAMKRRITVGTATTTPMMPTVSIALGPGGGGGEGGRGGGGEGGGRGRAGGEEEIWRHTLTSMRLATDCYSIIFILCTVFKHKCTIQYTHTAISSSLLYKITFVQTMRLSC